MNYITMLLSDIINEMASGKLTKLKINITPKFLKWQIQTNFSRHFSERSLDGNIDDYNNIRGDLIDYDELTATIDKFLNEYKSYLIRKQKWAGIIRDNSNDLNIVFRLTFDESNRKKTFHFITVMKKEDFIPGAFKFYYV